VKPSQMVSQPPAVFCEMRRCLVPLRSVSLLTAVTTLPVLLLAPRWIGVQ